eukprot:SAG11_NODE_20623_length_441_cov_1.739766_1_plen_27_part_01
MVQEDRRDVGATHSGRLRLASEQGTST